MRSELRILLCILVLAIAPGTAGEAGLGVIDFPNSGSPEAQETFLQAVRLLHSFEYEDARELFLQAQSIDPDFVLAYWGEVMTHNHPLWRQQDRPAALEALEKIASTPQERLRQAPTERERGYLSAVEVLYGDGEKQERDFAYSDAMQALSRRYPDDLEARAFHALSILGTAQGERDFRIYVRAGAVAQEVFDANRMHPGAAHYMIHSFDDPVHAPLGLRAARVYAKIAPAASHAQHMISHIYVAMGLWKESVAANVASFAVSADRRDRKDLELDALNYHALHWLEYSYLQLGRRDEARKALEQMTRYARESGSKRALWYHAAMRAAWIVETGGLEAPDEIDLQKAQVTGAAAGAFATGYAALLAGDREMAERSALAIGSRREVASSGPLCDMTSGRDSTTKRDLLVAEILQNSLQALIELDRGKTEAALALLEEVTAAEEAMPMDFGPPIIVKPTNELYGELLLQLGRPEEARLQFEKALERAPRRSLSLAGLARAARATGQAAVGVGACAELATIHAGADKSVSVPGGCSEETSVGRLSSKP